MIDHEYCEVLCTLAASGQLAASERANFDEHCLHCAACRDQLQELLSIGMQLQLDAAMHVSPASMRAGSVERFRARAIREGITSRTAPARPSPFFVMAMVSVIFVIVAAVVFMPHGRKAPEHLANINAEQTPSPQSLSASITARTLIPRHSRPVPIHSLRHSIVPHTDMEVNGASLTAQQFPQAITASYAFFGLQSATKSSVIYYPVLNSSQISGLDLFRNLDDSNNRNLAVIDIPDRPINMASTGNVFDFSSNIRQLHFQLSSAQ
jgi:hypothetical protein